MRILAYVVFGIGMLLLLSGFVLELVGSKNHNQFYDVIFSKPLEEKTQDDLDFEAMVAGQDKVEARRTQHLVSRLFLISALLLAISILFFALS